MRLAECFAWPSLAWPGLVCLYKWIVNCEAVLVSVCLPVYCTLLSCAVLCCSVLCCAALLFCMFFLIYCVVLCCVVYVALVNEPSHRVIRTKVRRHMIVVVVSYYCIAGFSWGLTVTRDGRSRASIQIILNSDYLTQPAKATKLFCLLIFLLSKFPNSLWCIGIV